MIYYLGIDAGGTSSSAMLFDAQGDMVTHIKKESMHYMRVGFDGISRILSEIQSEINNLNLDMTQLNVAIGMAGFGSDRLICESIETSVFSVFKDAFVTNDAHFAMIAALNDGDGVYCISGTGSIAFRKNGDQLTRKGGFGYLLDDEGSAYWIGRQLLSIFTQEDDGRIEQSPFYDAVLNEFNISCAYDLVSIANNQKDDYRQWVAEFARIGSQFMASDHIKAVYVSAGERLALMANAFKITDTVKIACGGSVLTHNQCVKESFIKALDLKFEFVDQTIPVEKSVYLIFNR